MHESPDSPDVVLQLFRERQRAADKTRNPLSKGAVEALDVVCSAAALAHSLMAFTREHLGVRLPEVGIEHGTLPIDSR